MEFLQGEVYWAVAKDLDIAGHEQMKSRPYVIVSRTLLNQASPAVVGVPLTSKLHKANAHCILIPAAHIIKDVGCSRDITDSVALTNHIRVLDKTRLEQPKMGKLSDTAMGAIELGLAYLFDIR